MTDTTKRRVHTAMPLNIGGTVHPAGYPLDLMPGEAAAMVAEGRAKYPPAPVPEAAPTPAPARPAPAAAPTDR